MNDELFKEKLTQCDLTKEELIDFVQCSREEQERLLIRKIGDRVDIGKSHKVESGEQGATLESDTEPLKVGVVLSTLATIIVVPFIIAIIAGANEQDNVGLAVALLIIVSLLFALLPILRPRNPTTTSHPKMTKSQLLVSHQLADTPWHHLPVSIRHEYEITEVHAVGTKQVEHLERRIQENIYFLGDIWAEDTIFWPERRDHNGYHIETKIGNDGTKSCASRGCKVCGSWEKDNPVIRYNYNRKSVRERRENLEDIIK
jgi:hypothetical protein